VDKRRFTTAIAVYLINPLARLAVRLGLARGSTAILETTGRRSGEPRRTPVTNGLDGDRFWIVAEHGRKAGYVRNIEADPRVRVNVGGVWRSGTARLLPDDDPRERLRALARARFGARAHLAMVRVVGTDLLTVRIDLDRPASR
jgi:deazaflavin-dependent oxidoreductase (nitroreductase family)